MVKKIQEFHLNFNKEFFPKWKGVSYDEKLLYLSIALAGEVGELSNVVKKRHRKKIHELKADDINEEEYKKKITEELVDVFVYTVLFSNELGIDLEKEFYKKMEKNKIKFKNGSTK